MIRGFWGFWYLVEVIGFLLIPCFLFANGVRHRSLRLVRFAAGYTLLGVILSRMNISIIAFNIQRISSEIPSSSARIT